MSVFFIVWGKPQGKARARTFYNKNAGRVTSMTPEKTVLYENYIKSCYMQAKKEIDSSWFNKEPLKVEITAYYEIPKSTTKKAKEQMLRGIIFPTKKVDADNLAKVVCDALNTVAYGDDAQIVELIVHKVYGEMPRVEVKIEEV